MIELPEAAVISRQMAEVLGGKRVKGAVRGNSPHKFAFYSGEPEFYARVLKGKRVGKAGFDGGLIVVPMEPGWLLLLGGGGERIEYHADGRKVPAKHQLLLEFGDGSFLSVRVSGWGSCKLEKRGSEEAKRWCGFGKGLMPTDAGFTLEYMDGLISRLKPGDARSVKYFVISEPGVRGVGNGYLQDILFQARVHPRKRVVELTAKERRALHGAIVETIGRAIEEKGRDDEYDLHGCAGGYHRVMSAESAGEPCVRCGARIVKESFLGGAVYFCPACQEADGSGKGRLKK